jgi:hypothetical protein
MPTLALSVRADFIQQLESAHPAALLPTAPLANKRLHLSALPVRLDSIYQTKNAKIATL